jgi:hypothetical protein
MPPTYVVHLGNSRALTEASESVLTRSLLRDHVREALGLNEDDIVFSVINSKCKFQCFPSLTVKLCPYQNETFC